MKNSRLIYVLLVLTMLTGCTPPLAFYYVRNYTNQPLDVVLFFETENLDSSERTFLIYPEIVDPLRLSKYKSPEKRSAENLTASAAKIIIPPESTATFPLTSRSRPHFSIKTVIAVQKNILKDTLFHHEHPTFNSKFKVLREPVFRFFPTSSFVYDYPY